MPKHYILTPLGTAGDVNPFLWIGSLLRGRGHEVTFLSTTSFAVEKPETFDFKYLQIEHRIEFKAILKNPQTWHPWHGIRIFLSFAGMCTEHVFSSIQACLRSDMENVIIAPATAFGARLAREKLKIPLVTVHLLPSTIHSIYETPKHGLGWMTAAYWIWKRFFYYLPTPVDFYAGPNVRQACRNQQIHAPTRILNQWWHSPDGALCLFPNWFTKPQSDWPTPYVQAGFPLYDSNTEFQICNDLQKFLDSGSPPILFTLGSTIQHPGKFFEVAIKSCALLKRRALLISIPNVPIPNPLPDYVFAYKNYVPFSWIFSKVAAVVHHGGIGTISLALAAGIPQLITPYALDQPDNAHRLIKLGTARIVYPSQFTLEKVSKELTFLLTHATVNEACKIWARQFSLDNTSTKTLDFLENIAKRE